MDYMRLLKPSIFALMISWRNQLNSSLKYRLKILTFGSNWFQPAGDGPADSPRKT